MIPGQGICWMISMKMRVWSLLIAGVLQVSLKIFVFMSTMRSAWKKKGPRREVCSAVGSLTLNWWGVTGGRMQNTPCHYLVRRKIHVQSLGNGSPRKDEDPVQSMTKWRVSVACVCFYCTDMKFWNGVWSVYVHALSYRQPKQQMTWFLANLRKG